MTTQDEQIIDCENRLIEAMKTGNIPVLEELIHDNLLFTIPTGQTITKEIDIEHYRSKQMTVEEISTSDRIIKTSDQIATVAVTVYLKAKYADQNIDDKFRYLRVWKWTDNGWQVIAGCGFQLQ